MPLNPGALKSLWVTSFLFLSTMSPTNHTLRSQVKGNDHQLKKLLIVKQILLVSTLGNYREQYREDAYPCYGVLGQVFTFIGINFSFFLFS